MNLIQNQSNLYSRKSAQTFDQTNKKGYSKLYQYHSKELKFRLIYILLTWCCIFIVIFMNMEFILYKYSLYEITGFNFYSAQPSNTSITSETIFNKTINGFIFTEVFEAFFTYILFSSYIAFLITLPFIYYHLYKFLLPGISYSEALLFRLFFCLSLSLLLVAHILTYFVILPYALSFFLNFQTGLNSTTLNTDNTDLYFSKPDELTNIIPNITFLGRIYPWINFLINVFTGVSLLFQLPLLLFILFLFLTKISQSSLIQDFKIQTRQNREMNNSALSTTRQSSINDPGSLFNSEVKSSRSNKVKTNKINLNTLNTTFTRKILFFILVLITAIFSPPDLYSQVFLFIPLFFIIELFLFAVILYIEYLDYTKSFKINLATKF